MIGSRSGKLVHLSIKAANSLTTLLTAPIGPLIDLFSQLEVSFFETTHLIYQLFPRAGVLIIRSSCVSPGVRDSSLIGFSGSLCTNYPTGGSIRLTSPFLV